MSALTEDDRLRLEERLCNWADWATQSSGGVATCASAEGRHVIPKDAEALVAAARIRAIDAEDAEKVERAIGLLRHVQQAYLKLRYLKHMGPKYLQSRLRYKADQQDDLHAKMLLSFKAAINQIERPPMKLMKRGALHWAGLAKR